MLLLLLLLKLEKLLLAHPLFLLLLLLKLLRLQLLLHLPFLLLTHVLRLKTNETTGRIERDLTRTCMASC